MARRLIPPNGVRAADAVESSVGREGALGPWRAAGYGRRQQGRGGAGIGVRAEGARPLSGALRSLSGAPVVSCSDRRWYGACPSSGARRGVEPLDRLTRPVPCSR
ncbi:hypothetical protein EES45_14270 [Streptomyces sp. ADI97-07]|nr:hypothetical protein EES45_14270 [Streptomyces sp. ADI97-07]